MNENTVRMIAREIAEVVDDLYYESVVIRPRYNIDDDVIVVTKYTELCDEAAEEEIYAWQQTLNGIQIFFEHLVARHKLIIVATHIIEFKKTGILYRVEIRKARNS